MIHALQLECVPGGVQNRQILDDHTPDINRQKAFLSLTVLERQHGLVNATALDEHILGVRQLETRVQFEIAAVELDDVLGSRLNHGRDHVRSGFWPRRDQKGATNRFLPPTTHRLGTGVAACAASGQQASGHQADGSVCMLSHCVFLQSRTKMIWGRFTSA